MLSSYNTSSARLDVHVHKDEHSSTTTSTTTNILTMTTAGFWCVNPPSWGNKTPCARAQCVRMWKNFIMFVGNVKHVELSPESCNREKSRLTTRLTPRDITQGTYINVYILSYITCESRAKCCRAKKPFYTFMPGPYIPRLL